MRLTLVNMHVPFFRAEKNYAVGSGKWYFEFEILTAGPMRVGWAKADCAPGSMLGSDENTWAFDGYNVSICFVMSFGNDEFKDLFSKN